MTWDGMTPEQMVAAQQQVDTFGERALQIINELIECYRDGSYARGGMLCKEMWQQPDLLMLVVGRLTAMVIENATGPLVPVNPSDIPPLKLWERAAADQMDAAAESSDIAGFARIAVDAQIRAFLEDMERIVAAGGDPPGVEEIMQSYLSMDRISVVALASESLRRLVLQAAG